jgi:lysozyme
MKKTRKTLIKKWSWLIVALSGILVFFLFIKYKEYKSSFIRYRTFGVRIPSHYEVYGIDVSHYQGFINWKTLKTMEVKGVKCHFAFIKATQGSMTLDPFYLQNKMASRNARVPAGYYHFFVASKDPETQAELFCRWVKPHSGDLAPVVDIEKEFGQSPEKIRKNLKIWLKKVEKAFGVKPIIYSNVGFYKRYLDGYFDEYPKWLAQYVTFKSEPAYSGSWQFWQFTEEANLNGIKGNVDFNVFKGSRSELEKYIQD